MALITVLLNAPAAFASDLTRAIEANDLARVNTLLQAGANPNEQTLGGAPLNVAASSGSMEIAVALIDKGADIESVGPLGTHPLHAAAAAGNLAMTKLLIAHAAKIDAVDSKGSTPLIAAVFKPENAGSIEVVKLLLAAGADPRLQESVYQMTAIHFAGAKGNTEIAGLLLAAGVDVNLKDGHGDTALHHAAGDGRLETASFLIAHGADVNAVDNDGQTPLRLTGDGVKMQELLIKSGTRQ